MLLLAFDGMRACCAATLYCGGQPSRQQQKKPPPRHIVMLRAAVQFLYAYYISYVFLHINAFFCGAMPLDLRKLERQSLE